MASTSQMRSWYAYARCTYGVVMDSEWTWGRSPVRCQPEWIPAATALFHAILASGYVPEADWPAHGWIGSARYCPAGIGGRICQPDGSWCSLHNYVVGTFDIEYDKNPHLKVTRPDPAWMFARCKFTPENIEAIEAIRFNNGEQAFRWLGWSIGDTMHVQGNASRVALASGINWDTVLGWEANGTEDVMFFLIRKHWTPEDIQLFSEMGLFGGNWRYWANDLGVWSIDEARWDKFTAEVIAKGLAKGLTIAGSEGPQGPRGPEGPKGSQGDDGIDGNDGIDGAGLEPGATINLATEATIV